MTPASDKYKLHGCPVANLWAKAVVKADRLWVYLCQPIYTELPRRFQPRPIGFF